MRSTIIAFLLLINFVAYAQDFTTSDNTLLSLTASIEDDWVEKLDDYKPVTSRVKDDLKANMKLLENTLEKGAAVSVYKVLVEQKKIVLKDQGALKDYVTYNQNGLPVPLIAKTAIKKVTGKGYQTDYYFVVNILPSLSLGRMMKGLPGQFKPEMKCIIKIFDNNKEMIKKVEAKFKPKKPIKKGDFPKRKFDKLKKEYIILLAEKLQLVTDEAIKSAVKQL